MLVGWEAAAVETSWFKCFMRLKCNLLDFKYLMHQISISIAGKPALLCSTEMSLPSPGIFQRFGLGVLDAAKPVEVCVMEMKLQLWSKARPRPLNLITAS